MEQVCAHGRGTPAPGVGVGAAPICGVCCFLHGVNTVTVAEGTLRADSRSACELPANHVAAGP